MTYKVTEDFKGSPNGHTVIQFKKGEEFTHQGDLLEVALKEGWVKSDAPKKVKGGKSADATPADGNVGASESGEVTE
jgi:hypothetical protein